MFTLSLRRAAVSVLGLTGLALTGLAVGACLPVGAGPAFAASAQASKDIGPVNAACDRFEKSSQAWAGCAGQAKANMPSKEAFYAGYWLAKSGRYEEALRYLTQASEQDERVLTYIGFATRKLGDVDGALPYYGRALALNPNYSVARAYLGDAYLSKGEPAKAKAQLAEIGSRCGTSCAEYAELAGHIADFEGKTVVR